MVCDVSTYTHTHAVLSYTQQQHTPLFVESVPVGLKMIEQACSTIEPMASNATRVNVSIETAANVTQPAAAEVRVLCWFSSPV